MIPFKVFVAGMVGLTGVGWVISGAVQKPPAKTIKDFVDMGPDGCIKSFHKDRDGFQPVIKGCEAGGALVAVVRKLSKYLREQLLINF